MLFSSREKDVVVALLTVFTKQNQNILIGTLTPGAADATNTILLVSVLIPDV